MRSAAEILIEAQSSGAALTGNEAIVVLADGDGTPRVWLGHQQDGAPSAYFEVEVPRDLNFSVSQVISVRALQVEDESSTGMTIPVVKLTCHDRKLDRVFCAFVDELRERIHDGANVVAVIHASASDWRSLLQVAAISLSENAAAGIYGELRLLEAIVAELGAAAASMWQRSPREMHDFIGLGARIEVKTSAFQNRAAVTIHGLRQLEPPETGTLTLAVAEVQKHGGETIDTVVNRLRDRGVDGQLLTEKLRDSGYVAGMPGSEEFAFELRSWRFWEVTPRSAVLNRSAVPEAISDAVSSLSYSLNLSGLGDAEETFDFGRLVGTEGADL